jgi:membrane protein YqaA with SNARE-associated domain
MFDFELGYWGLFISSFLAATILPVASEVFLGAMLALGYDPIVSLVVATVGNTLGGYLNYFLGLIGNPKWLIKVGVKEDKVLSWENAIQKYGVWLALLSWLPFIGDVIGIALGFFRVNWVLSFVFIAIGKFVRYVFIVIFFLYFQDEVESLRNYLFQ